MLLLLFEEPWPRRVKERIKPWCNDPARLWALLLPSTTAVQAWELHRFAVSPAV
jgi:hypothetical protein